MLIKIIPNIKEQIADIASVTYSFIGTKTTETVEFSQAVLNTMLQRNIDRFDINDKVFVRATLVNISIVYANDSIKSLNFTHPLDLVWRKYEIEKKQTFNPTIKRNANTPYEDTPENREMILSIVDNLYNDVEEQENSSIRGSKNLIYFTVFGQGYLELLEQCLISINKTTSNKNFELLFICTPEMANKINALLVIVNFTVNYMAVARPADGIEASKNKCKVFDWANINDFNKILFLDCDIISVKDVSSIFAKLVDANKLYTVYNTTVPFTVHNSYTHGVSPATQDQLAVYDNYNQKPFNAGQFAFINTEKMQMHLENVRWFMDNWCGEYFFEQAFMVQYFCRNLMTKIDIIQDDFALVIIPENKTIKKLHNDDTVFIHFAGNTLNAERKQEYIQNYAAAYL